VLSVGLSATELGDNSLQEVEYLIGRCPSAMGQDGIEPGPPKGITQPGLHVEDVQALVFRRGGAEQLSHRIGGA
jgi:hypothetical protein